MQQSNTKQVFLLVTVAIGFCIAAEAHAVESKVAVESKATESKVEVSKSVSHETKTHADPAHSNVGEKKVEAPKAETPKTEPLKVEAPKAVSKENAKAPAHESVSAAPITSESPAPVTVTAPAAPAVSSDVSAAPTTEPAKKNPEPVAAAPAADADHALTLTLAKQVSTAAFTYDYKNYQQQFDGMAKYFTPEGWVAFSDALKRSNNIEEVKKDQISVNAKVEGEAKVVKQDVIKGSTVFKIEVPLSVTYKGLTQNIQQSLLVEVVVVPVAPSISPDGIAVTQFIAKTVNPVPPTPPAA